MSGNGSSEPARLVVLVSGEGSTLQAILDACTSQPDYGCHIVAVGADRVGTRGEQRAAQAGIPTFVARIADYPDRVAWDADLTAQVAAYQPDLVVCAGFLKVLGATFISTFGGRIVNTHPSLLPSFPGPGNHAVRATLDYGVKLSGVTVHFIDAGIDTGTIIAQQAVPVYPDDDVESLFDRIKNVERPLFVETVGQVARQMVAQRVRRGAA